MHSVALRQLLDRLPVAICRRQCFGLVTCLAGPGRVRVLSPTLWAGRLITMTTRKRHTPEQVVRKLTQADRLLAGGKDVADVCRELQVSEQTYYRWRNQFGGLKADDAKRLKDLEKENSTLKRMLADAELEKAALKETARGTSEPGAPAGSRSPPHESHGHQ